VLRELLDSDADAVMPADALKLIEDIAALMPSEPAPLEAGVLDSYQQDSSEPAEDIREVNLYKVEFHPDRELFSSGTNPITLLRNLAALGTVSCCHLHMEELPALADLDPEQCYLSWTVELASRCAEASGGDPHFSHGSAAATRLRAGSELKGNRESH
jgi:two-component system chemotaxis sensor kinase CheA